MRKSIHFEIRRKDMTPIKCLTKYRFVHDDISMRITLQQISIIGHGLYQWNSGKIMEFSTRYRLVCRYLREIAVLNIMPVAKHTCAPPPPPPRRRSSSLFVIFADIARGETHGSFRSSHICRVLIYHILSCLLYALAPLSSQIFSFLTIFSIDVVAHCDAPDTLMCYHWRRQRIVKRRDVSACTSYASHRAASGCLFTLALKNHDRRDKSTGCSVNRNFLPTVFVGATMYFLF